MMLRVRRTCGRSLIACVTLVVWGCAGENPPAAESPPATAHPEQALIDDLVLANRMLARELDILDTRGHTSARSRLNPNRYFMPRYLSPGAITASDIVENDLDSNPVDGPRNDQAREVYLHGEIYKARPDVMAVLVGRAPELTALTEASVQLRPVVNGGAFLEDGLPTLDVGSLDPRQPLLTNPALGRAAADALAKRAGVLLPGDGFVLTDSTLYALMYGAYALRMNARIQQQAIALRGTVAHLDDVRRAPAASPPAGQAPAAQLGPPEGRDWVYWTDNVALD